MRKKVKEVDNFEDLNLEIDKGVIIKRAYYDEDTNTVNVVVESNYASNLNTVFVREKVLSFVRKHFGILNAVQVFGDNDIDVVSNDGNTFEKFLMTYKYRDRTAVL